MAGAYRFQDGLALYKLVVDFNSIVLDLDLLVIIKLDHLHAA